MYKRIPVNKLTGNEQFKNVGDKKFSVLEFWRYGFSNLNSNVLRGALAEFIVENSLRSNEQIDVRNPWGDSDVIAPNGKNIEVKCCSYIQDWDQDDYSRISWSGLKAKHLFYTSLDRNLVSQNLKERPIDYKSDIYVLSLFKHQDHATLDILDMDQWCFWVLTKDKIKEITKNGNSVSLIKLQKFDIEPISFGELNKTISSS
ncbi:hypothetical protein A2737_01580 [Candidatus Nomurabacteria bacterium RIFCSPHIGHO2_01_FULL_41_71]|nr:MAG: hypothetical protein A2737_01580 [Candidatus Nomurabacteria bacterium RIFCSPHIGHO2_01_FULL_41_71]OGI89163.1 MAG: hypothetical protein A3B01_01625 [Candidatus Nomurabacteria bacterium RIFCSPLOWO2_01_FULL_41_52b]